MDGVSWGWSEVGLLVLLTLSIILTIRYMLYNLWKIIPDKSGKIHLDLLLDNEDTITYPFNIFYSLPSLQPCSHTGFIPSICGNGVLSDVIIFLLWV